MRLVIIALIATLCSSCANTQFEETVQIQQNSIDEMSSKLETLETMLGLQQKKIDILETQMQSLETGVEKVTPGYLEGNIQEGSN